VFTISLPACPVAAAPVAASAARDDGARRTVLIVDDEAEIREALSEILVGARHRVVAAASGREALEHMAKQRFDVILTDIRMPDVDGRALYDEIQRRWPAQAGRVVFITGDTLTSTLREFVARSGRPVIEKPFLPSEVRRVVAGLAVDRAAAPPR
jgi:CheY-like chemotaxis protein